MKHLFLSMAIACGALTATAQTSTPIYQWGNVADGATAAGDNCIANAATSDGGCVWLGSYATAAGATDIHYGSSLLFSTENTPASALSAANLTLMKTDGNGEMVWQIHTLGADCGSANGGVAVTSDGGCVFAGTIRHADVEAMPVIRVIDDKGVEYSLDWSPTQRSYSIVAGKVDAAGAIEWLRLYHPSTQPGVAAAGNTADFWSNCINLGNVAVDAENNIYMVMNLRNPLAVPVAAGDSMTISVQNNTEWTGDSQKAAGDFVLLSLNPQGYYRNHLNIKGECQVAYGQRVTVSDRSVYAQGYITGNGHQLTAGDIVLSPSEVISPTLLCADTDLNVKWAKCYPGATVGGKYGFQYTNLNVVGNTLWMNGMFNLSFGDGDHSISSIQGAVREGFILKLDSRDGSWLGACTSRSGNFDQPSAVANTGLTGYIDIIQPKADDNRIYVYGYVMNATVGVFLREYDSNTLTPNLTDGQWNIITGGGVPTAMCASYDASTGAVFAASRGNKAFVPLGGTATVAPSAWAVYMSRFNLPSDISTAIAPTLDDASTCEEYFTLQGCRVSATQLTPGLYIRRHGNTVEKVMIK